MQGVFLLCLILLVAFGACRRNQPSLVDKNETPETQLWYAPPDSTEYEYLVHLYWRGVDNDGTAESFIWTIKDTLVEGELAWNPSERLRDFREGRITTRTDSIFSFTAFKDVNGIGIKKNRQAFHIAAIDDNGAPDPSPAAIEFVATIDQLPRMAFATHIGGTSEAYIHRDIPKDTVGVMQPFNVTYHGLTTNGVILAYWYSPLTTGVQLEGQDIWTEDLTDTTRHFANTGANMIPSGIFKFSAKCRDEADAESPVDAGQFRQGVCQVVVNWDPETHMSEVFNSYTVNDVVYEDTIDFRDAEPDTVPYLSWVKIRYWGEDSDEDGKLACNDLSPDSCIGFQAAYNMWTVYSDFSEFSQWQPRGGIHDTDPFSSTDTNTFHIGTLEYELMARAVDEHGRPDGTPPGVIISGNFEPTLDSVAVEDHFGNRLDLSVVDTLTWNFWKGEGWPYQCLCDTTDYPEAFCGGQPNDPFECANKPFPANGSSFDYYKQFAVHIKGWGHDHAKDPTSTSNDPLGSGVKSWRYLVRNEQGQYINFGKGLADWFVQVDENGDPTKDVLDDAIRWKVFYPGPFTDPTEGGPDPMGDTVFENLPSWMDQQLTFFLIGKDTPVNSGSEFEQTIFINGQQLLINSFGDATLGRRTHEKVFAFVIRLVR